MVVLNIFQGVVNIKLKGNLIPVCAWCNRVRDENGEWHKVDLETLKRDGFELTHAICPDCKKRLMEDKLAKSSQALNFSGV